LEDLKEKVIEIISEVSGVRIVDIEPKSKLYDNLNIDSLDIIDVVLELEEYYVIAIEDSDADKWKTVQDVINFIKSQE